jgi:hypothetical protein
MTLGLTQPLTETNTMNVLGGKGRKAHKADNLTAICESILQIMWDPQRLTTLWTFTACYRDRFTFIYQTIWHHIAEDYRFNNHHENHRSHGKKFLLCFFVSFL